MCCWKVDLDWRIRYLWMWPGIYNLVPFFSFLSLPSDIVCCTASFCHALSPHHFCLRVNQQWAVPSENMSQKTLFSFMLQGLGILLQTLESNTLKKWNACMLIYVYMLQFLKENKIFLNKWKVNTHLWIGKLHIANMSLLLKVTYKYNTILNKVFSLLPFLH